MKGVDLGFCRCFSRFKAKRGWFAAVFLGKVRKRVFLIKNKAFQAGFLFAVTFEKVLELKIPNRLKSFILKVTKLWL